MKLYSLLLLAPGLFGQTAPDKELIALETQFFAAWQNKSLDAVQKNIAAEGVQWSEWGTFDKAAQIANQKAGNNNCTVHSFELKDMRVLPVSADSAMLIYTVSQDATCGGSPAPTPVSNSSLWVKRRGHWLNVYRASVSPKR